MATWLTNWQTTKRLKIQLAHDSGEKIAERKQTLRREIYLQAAEEIPKAMAFLISLPRLDFSQPDALKELNSFNVVCSKLLLVTDFATSEKVRHLQKTFFNVFTLSMLKSPAVFNCQRELDNLFERAKELSRRISDSTSELSVREMEQPMDDETVRYLKLEMKVLQQELEVLDEQIDTTVTNCNTLRKDFVTETFTELKTIGIPMANVLAAMRKELGLDGDIDEFHRATEQQWEDVTAALQRFISSSDNS